MGMKSCRIVGWSQRNETFRSWARAIYSYKLIFNILITRNVTVPLERTFIISISMKHVPVWEAQFLSRIKPKTSGYYTSKIVGMDFKHCSTRLHFRFIWANVPQFVLFKISHCYAESSTFLHYNRISSRLMPVSKSFSPIT